MPAPSKETPQHSGELKPAEKDTKKSTISDKKLSRRAALRLFGGIVAAALSAPSSAEASGTTQEVPPGSIPQSETEVYESFLPYVSSFEQIQQLDPVFEVRNLQELYLAKDSAWNFRRENPESEQRIIINLAPGEYRLDGVEPILMREPQNPDTEYWTTTALSLPSNVQVQSSATTNEGISDPDATRVVCTNNEAMISMSLGENSRLLGFSLVRDYPWNKPLQTDEKWVDRPRSMVFNRGNLQRFNESTFQAYFMKFINKTPYSPSDVPILGVITTQQSGQGFADCEVHGPTWDGLMLYQGDDTAVFRCKVIRDPRAALESGAAWGQTKANNSISTMVGNFYLEDVYAENPWKGTVLNPLVINGVISSNPVNMGINRLEIKREGQESIGRWVGLNTTRGHLILNGVRMSDPFENVGLLLPDMDNFYAANGVLRYQNIGNDFYPIEPIGAAQADPNNKPILIFHGEPASAALKIFLEQRNFIVLDNSSTGSRAQNVQAIASIYTQEYEQNTALSEHSFAAEKAHQSLPTNSLSAEAAAERAQEQALELARMREKALRLVPQAQV